MLAPFFFPIYSLRHHKKKGLANMVKKEQVGCKKVANILTEEWEAKGNSLTHYIHLCRFSTLSMVM
jgi:hypothetical protein